MLCPELLRALAGKHVVYFWKEDCSEVSKMIFTCVQKYDRLFLHLIIFCICVFVYLYFCICAFGTRKYHFWDPFSILFSKIYHILGLSSTWSFSVFVYLCICVFVFLYFCVWHKEVSFLRSLINPLFKNIPHVGSF